MPSLRSLIAQLLLRWRAPIATAFAGPEQWMGEAQRFGGSAWQKIAERWPALAELLRERTSRRARGRHVKRAAPQATVPDLAPEATDALIVQLMAASSWQARAEAALSLAPCNDDGVIEALLHALRDPSVEVAVACVDALTRHTDQRATQGLLQVLQNQDGYFSPVTRVAAVSALAERLSSDQFEPIASAVRDIDAEVSIAAAAVITERAPQLASTQLLLVLRDGSGFYLPIVRLAIANALERAGLLYAGVVHELLPAERDPAVRRVFERASHLTGEIVLGK
jgi:HEAT repeat protein